MVAVYFTFIAWLKASFYQRKEPQLKDFEDKNKYKLELEFWAKENGRRERKVVRRVILFSCFLFGASLAVVVFSQITDLFILVSEASTKIWVQNYVKWGIIPFQIITAIGSLIIGLIFADLAGKLYLLKWTDQREND